MSDCTFARTAAEVDKLLNDEKWMYDCEGLYAAWVTDGDALAKALPEPLTPMSPMVFSYVIDVNNPSFGAPYKESALFTVAMKDGKPGTYMLGLLLEGSDNAIYMGREVLSIPKKYADDIKVERNGGKASVVVNRKGIDILKVDATMGDFNDPMCEKIYPARKDGDVVDGVSYYYKFTMNPKPQGNAIEDVTLLSSEAKMIYHSWENASVDVTLCESEADPWASLPCLKPLGGGWAKLDIGLLGVVGREPVPDPDKVLPLLIAARFDPKVYRQA